MMHKEIFVCLDCEATGLQTNSDRIIELAAAKFSLETIHDQTQMLVNPQIDIPIESQNIHHISYDMVKDKPTIDKVLPDFLSFIKSHIIIGHGILFDLELLRYEAQRHCIPFCFSSITYIDTLRLARLYGESPVNSLDFLRKHFNIPSDGAHRAMNDVLVNIEVFKHLVKPFKTLSALLKRMEKPIALKIMPLGKHKGRKFSEIPMDYLQWAANKSFDQDLLYSIRLELKNRKHKANFHQASNPFLDF
jgi:DNA polymerase-3 subunit epsilon